jgi:hypothetical protein
MGKIYIEREEGAEARLALVLAGLVREGLTFEVRETNRHYIVNLDGGF